MFRAEFTHVGTGYFEAGESRGRAEYGYEGFYGVVGTGYWRLFDIRIWVGGRLAKKIVWGEVWVREEREEESAWRGRVFL